MQRKGVLFSKNSCGKGLTEPQKQCAFVHMDEILLYKTDNAEVKIEILLQNENLWLTHAKRAELQGRTGRESSCFQNGNNWF